MRFSVRKQKIVSVKKNIPWIPFGILIFSIFIAGLIIVLKSSQKEFLPEASLPPQEIKRKELSPEVQKFLDQAVAFENPVLVSDEFIPEEKKGYMQMAYNREEKFEVTYEANEDKFTIIVLAPESEEEFLSIKQRAEDYFVTEVLHADDKETVCGLNVVIFVAWGGTTPIASISPNSPLSFCET